MARRNRLDAPRVAHHVMLRGLDGARIFLDAEDHQDFVQRLVRLLPECSAHCLAWALMPNHAHLVVYTDRGELSRLMRRLNTGYAARFNRVYARRGYVFQDRFRSRIAEGDADLIGLIRYVHSNPLEAGLAESLDALARFPWSGHGALVGARPPLAFEDAEEALRLFDPDDPQRARAKLCAWMAREDLPAVGEPAGSEVPSPRGYRQVEVAAERSTAWEPQGRIGLDHLIAAASEHYRLTFAELASGSKQPRIVRARAAIAWVAVVELGVSGRRIGQALGISPSAVSNAAVRGRRVALEDGFHSSAILSPAGKKQRIPNS